MGKIYKNGIEYGGGGGSGTGGHTIVDTDGNPVADEPKLQFTGLDVQDNSTDSETEVAAFGLNTDSLDDVIASANVPGTAVSSNGLVYSTTEQVVGKWIDGKPIYQKTISFTTPSSTSDDIIATINEVINIKSFEGIVERNDGRTFPVNFQYLDQGLSCYAIKQTTNTVIRFKPTLNADCGIPGTLTIKYTKVSN